MDLLIEIIGNYFLIQCAILLFFAPFYAVYLYHHNKYHPEQLTISEHLERFFISREANYLVLLWAALEAIVWFVIPEYLLLLLVFLRIKRKIQLLVYDITGTLLGTTIAFFLPFHTESAIAHLPYIQPNMIRQVAVWYQHIGVLGLLFQPFSGVPYKVFTLLAPNYHFFFVTFLIVAVLARISRYYFFYLIFTNIYPFVHRFVYKNYVPLFFVAGFIFSIALLKVYSVYGVHYVVDYTIINQYPFLSQ